MVRVQRTRDSSSLTLLEMLVLLSLLIVSLSVSHSTAACLNYTGTHDTYTGTIISPNYPSPYPPVSTCYWQISADSNIVINLQDFHTRFDSDVLTISNFDTEVVLQRWSGNLAASSSSPIVLNTNTKRILLKFSCNSSSSSTGFKLAYTPVTPSSSNADVSSEISQSNIISIAVGIVVFVAMAIGIIILVVVKHRQFHAMKRESAYKVKEPIDQKPKQVIKKPKPKPANVFTIGGNFSNPKDMVFENPFDFDDEEDGSEKSDGYHDAAYTASRTTEGKSRLPLPAVQHSSDASAFTAPFPPPTYDLPASSGTRVLFVDSVEPTPVNQPLPERSVASWQTRSINTSAMSRLTPSLKVSDEVTTTGRILVGADDPSNRPVNKHLLKVRDRPPSANAVPIRSHDQRPLSIENLCTVAAESYISSYNLANSSTLPRVTSTSLLVGSNDVSRPNTATSSTSRASSFINVNSDALENRCLVTDDIRGGSRGVTTINLTGDILSVPQRIGERLHLATHSHHQHDADSPPYHKVASGNPSNEITTGSLGRDHHHHHHRKHEGPMRSSSQLTVDSEI